MDAGRPTVFWFVNTHAGWVQWSEWAQEADPSIEFADPEGPTAGEGTTVAWYAAGEPAGTIEIVESTPPEEVRYVMEVPAVGLRKEGTVLLEEAAGGTRVTWSESGDLGWNPIVRWLAFTSRGTLAEDLQRGLLALKEDAEAMAPPAPEPVPAPPIEEALPQGDGAGAVYEGL